MWKTNSHTCTCHLFDAMSAIGMVGKRLETLLNYWFICRRQNKIAEGQRTCQKTPSAKDKKKQYAKRKCEQEEQQQNKKTKCSQDNVTIDIDN